MSIVSGTHDGLELRQLGSVDISLSRIGLGGWAWGGADWAAGWGPQDDNQSIGAIHRAVDAGVNWIDTAAIYGLGHSEEVVRRALQMLPRERRPYVFTKCGLACDDPKSLPSRIGSAQKLRSGLEDSLRRLAVERIDLLQMHFPAEDETPIEDYWQTLLDLKHEGKVRAVGLSNHDTTQLEAAERIGHVDAVQARFSAINRDIAADLLPWSERHGAGVIVYSPMQSGLLTGTFDAERARALRSDDWRSRSADFSGKRLARNLALVDALRAIAVRRNTTVATIAIAWTLAWPAVTGAIVGARGPLQVDGWIGAATLNLDDEELREIGAAIAATRAGHGPSRPDSLVGEKDAGSRDGSSCASAAASRTHRSAVEG
jgi:aryl-alcohol dehydrogenase-like predicted oxidoreductase